MKDKLRKINELFEHGSALAIELVESEARKILFADSELDEFVMAMGGCLFTTTNTERGYAPRGGGSNILDESEIAPKFFEMVEDLNDRFNVKGCPMRFTAKGKIRRDW
jgi:hypothetical protein